MGKAAAPGEAIASLLIAAACATSAVVAEPNRVPNPNFTSTGGVKQGTTGTVPNQWRAFAIGDGASTTIVAVAAHELFTGCAATFVVSHEFANCDINKDDYVDQADFGILQRCCSGEFVPQTDPACRRAPLDSDNDVDLYDIVFFLPCMSGPGIRSNLTCGK
jgi:hypothetical protein